MSSSVWQKCVERLQQDLSSAQFNTWIRPLQVQQDEHGLRIFAPNRYVKNKIYNDYLSMIIDLLDDAGNDERVDVSLEVGNIEDQTAAPLRADGSGGPRVRTSHRLQEDFNFDSFVKGNSNELAFAAAMQVAENAGRSYNPLLMYGGVGLGKTHLMHAVGNAIRAKDPRARVVYVHSQRFVQDMVNALQRGTMGEFGDYYGSIDALLIDDIQFFAKKLRSQEEFFNVFNGLLERDHQVVLTSDRYPSEIDGLEERLKSRFVWGLTVEIEPPDLETRVAILQKKAEADQVALDPEVAFFIAENVRSNVRELEGALRRVIANAKFTGQAISNQQVRRALRDLFAIAQRQVSIPNIQRTVAEYYSIKQSDLLSKRRNRTIARPRQMAMFLAKELTSHSLPEIGDAFGGRDHTTVLHACRKIRELKESTPSVSEDYRNLSRLVSG